MWNLLSPEEKQALQEPYPGSGARARSVAPALFPSVTQLGPDRAAALEVSTRLWLDLVASDLSRQLRLPCVPGGPRQEIVARATLPRPGEESFWARVDGHSHRMLLLSLPRCFAAAVCERFFGAPLQLVEERPLTRAEALLIQDFGSRWLRLLGRVLEGRSLQSVSAADVERAAPEEQDGAWIRLTAEISCGGVSGAIHLSLSPATARGLVEEDGAQGPAGPELLEAGLADVPLELRVVLGRAEFTLDELSGLQVGDVITLHRRVRDPLDVMIDETSCYRARAGLAGTVVALEIVGGTEESS